MERNDDGIVEKVFSKTGDAVLPTTYEAGFIPATSTPGSGVFPKRTDFNFLFKALTSLASDINRCGCLLPWDSLVNYYLGARVTGSNGKIYIAMVATGPATSNASNPTTPTPSIWQLSPEGSLGTMAQQNANNVNITDGNIAITQTIKSYGEALRILQSGGNAGVIFQRKDASDYLAAGYYNDSNTFTMGSYNGGGAALEIDTITNKVNFPNGAGGVFRTGMSMPFWGTTSSVPDKFIPWIDGTIGSTASGATIRANTDTQALYTLLWNSASDTNCPVTGGRGASAAADFAANKAIRVPRANGMVVGIAGAASTTGSITTSARNLADKTGEETHTLTINEMPTHNHQNGTASDLISGSEQSSTGVQAGVNGGQKALGILPQGGDQPHNNIQPTTFVTWIVAL